MLLKDYQAMEHPLQDVAVHPPQLELPAMAFIPLPGEREKAMGFESPRVQFLPIHSGHVVGVSRWSMHLSSSKRAWQSGQ